MSRSKPKVDGPLALRRYGNEAAPAILCIAGFGDDGTMFESLAETELAGAFQLITIDRPGFGLSPRSKGRATLDNFASVVHGTAVAENARIVLAHSMASIIASLSAHRQPSVIDTIVSLEGNLTADDAYFTGTAADYDEPNSFRCAFLGRLEEMAIGDPILARYRSVVAGANPQSLWELGCDVRRFSSTRVAGDVLVEAANVHYLYNPDNCSQASRDWLNNNAIPRTVMRAASHWVSVDQPDRLAKAIIKALANERHETSPHRQFKNHS